MTYRGEKPMKGLETIQMENKSPIGKEVVDDLAHKINTIDKLIHELNERISPIMSESIIETEPPPRQVSIEYPLYFDNIRDKNNHLQGIVNNLENIIKLIEL